MLDPKHLRDAARLWIDDDPDPATRAELEEMSAGQPVGLKYGALATMLGLVLKSGLVMLLVMDPEMEEGEDGEAAAPPPPPQHRLLSLLFVISTSLRPGMLCRTLRGAS